MSEPAKVAIGIDFGSTRTRLTYHTDGQYRSLPVMPSYVGFDQSTGKLVSGRDAEIRYYANDRQVVYNLKAAILRDEKFHFGRESFLAISLVSELLRTLVLQVEQITGHGIQSAVMTVPTFFSELHKGALKDAALISGLKHVRIISEPTAALLSYRERLRERAPSFEPRRVLILDTGGLTTDATLCTVTPDKVQVHGVHGSNRLGSGLVDASLTNLMVEKLIQDHYSPSASEIRTLQGLAQWVKVTYHGQDIPLELKLGGQTRRVILSASQIARAYQHYLERVVRIYEQITRESTDIAQVLLIGGPFQSDYVRNWVVSRMHAPTVSYPDQGYTVSKGAAIYAKSLGEGHRQVLSDVIPMAIGIETQGGYLSTIVPANSNYPSRYSRLFTTTQDHQTKLSLHVYQGSRPLVKDNIYLGTIVLTDIQPNARGIPEIEVSLQTDQDGLLSVQAKDLRTNRMQKATLCAQNRLSAPQREFAMKGMAKYRTEHFDLLAKLSLADTARTWRRVLEDASKLDQATSRLYEELCSQLRRVPLDYRILQDLVTRLSQDHRDTLFRAEHLPQQC